MDRGHVVYINIGAFNQYDPEGFRYIKDNSLIEVRYYIKNLLSNGNWQFELKLGII